MYFLMQKRKINVFILGYVFSTLYFIPVFTGISVDWTKVFLVSASAVPSGADFKSTESEVVLAYVFLCFAICFFDYLFHCIISERCYRPLKEINKEDVHFINTTFKLYFILFVLVYIVMLISGTLMKYSAGDDGVGLFHSVLISIIVVVSVLSIFSNNKKYLYVSVLVLFASLLTGSRTAIAIFFIVYGVIYFSDLAGGFFNYLIKRIYVLFFVFFGVLVVVFSKYCYTFYSLYGFWFLPHLFDYLFSDRVCLLCAFEPALQASFFDLIVANEFCPSVNYFNSFISLLPIPTSFFDYKGSLFSINIHEHFFPNAAYSIAGNSFGEAYAYGGMLGVLVFICLYCLVLFFFNYCLFYKFVSVEAKLLFLIPTIYAVFFIHRYALGSEFGHIRNFIYPYFLYLFIYKLFFKGRFIK